MNKRAEKQQRRKKKAKAREAKDERRQERLAEALQQPGAPEKIAAVQAYFSRYWTHEDPESFPGILALIDELNLQRLEEFRKGISAAIAGVYRQHPDRQRYWMSHHLGQIQAALRNCPDPEDGRWIVTEPYHVDQIMMLFLVSGDDSYLETLMKVARDEDHDCQWEAQRCLSEYQATIPEVAAWLEPLKVEQHPPEDQGDSDLRDLIDHLNSHPHHHHIAFVISTEDDFTVGTMTSKSPELFTDLPTVWRGKPLTVRPATPEERPLRQQWQQSMEEPL